MSLILLEKTAIHFDGFVKIEVASTFSRILFFAKIAPLLKILQKIKFGSRTLTIFEQLQLNADENVAILSKCCDKVLKSYDFSKSYPYLNWVATLIIV